MTIARDVETVLPLPRGWVIVGAAVTCWLMVAGAWMAVSQVMSFILTA